MLLYSLPQNEIIKVFLDMHGQNHFFPILLFSSVQSLSRVRPFVIPLTACSTPGFPSHHQLLELTQTHVHRVGDAIQPFHPFSFPSLPAFSLCQHQGLDSYLTYLNLHFSSVKWGLKTCFTRVLLRIKQNDTCKESSTMHT